MKMFKNKLINLIQKRFNQSLAQKIKHIRKDNKPTNYKPLLYVIPITTFGLGTWQVFRRQKKLELINLLEERLIKEPVPLPENLLDLEDHEYCKFIVKGKFDHSREFLIEPRSRIDNNKPTGGILSRNIQNGAWVITPLQLSGKNYSILVNRGWVPKHKMSKKNRKESLDENEVEFIGVLRFTEKRPPFTMKNDPEHNVWRTRDVDAMAFRNNCAPVFIDAIKDDKIKNGIIGGQTQVTIRNEHINYIITWYSLSLLTFLLTKKFV